MITKKTVLISSPSISLSNNLQTLSHLHLRTVLLRATLHYLHPKTFDTVHSFQATTALVLRGEATNMPTFQSVLQAMAMISLLWALFPLYKVNIPLGFETRTYFFGPGFQVRLPEMVLADALSLASFIELLLLPLLHATGPFTWLTHFVGPFLRSSQPARVTEALDHLIKPCRAPRGVQCTICHSEFTDPVRLTCSHTFCNDCIRATLAESDNCPRCLQQPTPWKTKEVPPVTPTGSWSLRCISTFLDVLITSLILKEIAPLLLDSYASKTLINLADWQIRFTLLVQITFLILSPTAFLGRSMGLSGLSDGVKSFIQSYAIVYGLLSSWGVKWGSFGSGVDLKPSFDLVREYLRQHELLR